MKKRITVEQLKELTEEQGNKLRVLWNPQVGDSMCLRSGVVLIIKEGTDLLRNKSIYQHRLPLLSIRQMIEILGDEIAEMSPTWNDDNKIIRWAVDVCNANYGGWFSSKELCDALWEAVKKIL
jgi:hypothetical protein